jgi:hypothetical protein
LAIDTNALKSDTYKGKILLLTVSIDNPSKFELAEDGTSVVVVVDVNKVRKYL